MNGADVERELQQLVERTGVSLACARAGLRFAIELAGCTTYSLTGTWRLVSRFLEAVFAGWKMRTATGLDPTDHLIELAAKLDVDPSD
jgi:hypothetical protein